MTARWMIALALLAALCFVGPATAAQFVEISESAGIPSAAGVGWGDYDQDGYADLFVAGLVEGYPGHTPHGPLLYHNDHDLTFTEVSESMGLASDPIEQDGVAWGDYDNDGDLDLLVGSGAGYPMLYRRDESGFTELGYDAGFHVTFSAGRGTAWCDYDGDNLLDAFCSNIFGPGYLMRNDGDGTFTEMSVAAGMTGDASNDAAQSASWGDYDNDGRPDLLLARMYKPAKLYHNNGDGTFADVSEDAGVTTAVNTLSALWADYDDDGWLDCYFTGGQSSPDWLFHNNQDGTFSDVAALAGMAGDHYNAQGAAWADYDNDGFMDLYVGNFEGENQPFLYHNSWNGTFTNVVVGSGIEGSYQNNGAAWGDMDLDGRLDLVQGTSNDRTRVFHNIGPAGNWLRVRTLTGGTGDATGSDPTRDAIGARVELNLDNDDSFPTTGHRTLTRLIDGGSGFCAQNEQIAQFGLGSATLVSVRVRFPDGSVVIHRFVQANQQITIRDVPEGRTEIFDDVPLDFWAYSQTKACVDAGIVSGYDDGLYHPDWPVTRDQMAVYISRALAGGDSEVPGFTGTPTFPDVPDTFWALKYVEYAVEQAVVTGYEDGNYHPEYEVNRAQMAVYVARALVAPTGEAALADYVPSDPRDFPDVPSDFWAYKHVEYCVEHGVVNGYDDGLYHPEIIVTRDQMAVYVARAFGL